MFLKSLWALVFPLIKMWGVLVNPHTLEWGSHYIVGLKTPKTLPEELVGITRQHVLAELTGRAGFDSKTLWGCARCLSYKGNEDWFTHPTMGVVGGFIYKLISYDDKFIIKCYDTWDFNTNLNYKIPLPPKVDVKVIKSILKRFKVPVSTYLVEETGESYLGIDEAWLSMFNESHSFQTIWEIELPSGIKCPINSPLKEIWVKEQRRKNRRTSFFSK